MDCLLLDCGPIALFEVVEAEVLVASTAGEEVVDDAEDLMTDGHHGALMAFPCGEGTEALTQIALLRMPRRPGRFRCRPLQPGVTLPSACGSTFAAARLIAGADAAP